MSTDEHESPRGPGGWQPTPQGEYDGDATAFVQLPPDMSLDAVPLAAPGHGYVPQEAWPHPHDPAADAHPTAHWDHQEAAAAQAASDLTGQWTVPVAEGDLPEESGEYHHSALAAQWTGGNPPATLPGGAAAPWATPPAPEPEPVPDHDRADVPAEPVPGGPAAEEPAYGEAPYGEARYDEPAAQDRVFAEPAHQEPAHQEPAHEDLAHRDLAHRDSAHREPPAHPEQPLPAPPGPGRPDGEGPAAEGPDTREPATEGPEPREQGAGGPAAQDPAAGPPAPQAAADGDEHPHVSYVLRVNGTDRPVTDAWVGESLLYVLRERLGLAGAKDGCSQGECGACNVQVDGRLVASCLVPAATAAGSEVRTVEGLAVDGEPSDVQRALAKCGAVQCGFCIPGMAMTVHDLLEGNHAPSELETRQALCGNLCRCTGYRGVLDAVREVVAERDAAAAAASAAATAATAAEAVGEVRIPHQVPHPHDGGTA
ncbi:2Fe-2S iron-sulfur cluster-binding protein [Streptomyces sp. HMX112]|uniref:2Fe-2S iron-sulfur cluster-binding protein n=1 Tax=Streptomyces sp. HMX112 TaxID=3390850 RepID=UPI003A8084A6